MAKDNPIPMRTTTASLAAKRLLAHALLGASLAFPFAGVALAEGDTDAVENTRTCLEEWVEIQRLTSKEKRDLALSKEMLAERIALLQREIDTTKEKIAEADKSIAEASGKQGEMTSRNDALKNASASLADTLLGLETRVKHLLKRLPDPIKDRVKPLSQRLPDDPKKSKLSFSERFQNVVGILNEVDKFDRAITVVSEVRTLPDKTTVEVTALYIGISMAYYTGANGAIAGVGVPSDDGWAWTPKNESAAEIARAVAILKNEEVAAFVRLPIQIQ